MNEHRNCVKEYILNRLRETNANVGHVVPQRWITTVLIPKLNPKERAEFEPAIQDLIDEGTITTDLALTQEGVDRIY